MSWLNGGPFLELSFIIEDVNQLEVIISQIQNVDVKIEVHIHDNMIKEFYEGYPYAQVSKKIHQMRLNLTVNTNRKRNALLFVERIGPELLCFTMCFFGDSMDAPEWNQPGVKHEEISEFIGLLISLYKEIKFVVGGLAIEEYVKVLFDTNEAWPHEEYKLSSIKVKHIEDNLSRFIALLINDNFNIQLPSVQCRHIGNSGMLIKDC